MMDEIWLEKRSSSKNTKDKGILIRAILIHNNKPLNHNLPIDNLLSMI